MRNVLLFFALFFCGSLYVKGQNNVVFHSHDGEPFRMILTGIKTPSNYQASLQITGITEDTLNVRAEFENGASINDRVILLDKGDTARNKEFSYLIGHSGLKSSIVFIGMRELVRLPEEIVPPEPVIDTTYKINNNLLGHYCELKEGRASYFNNIPTGKECKDPMPDNYIIFMNRLMRRAQTDDDRMAIAENTILNNCITTQHLEVIISHIGFEIEKLKLIKLAYFNVTDRSNCPKLKESFKLEASKVQLEDFIRNSHQYKINRGGNCTLASSESTIDQLYQQLSVYTNDFTRYDWLKKQYTSYCYSVSQVKMLLGLFLHDREKLDAAKLLYFYCTEKKDFLSVSPMFSYKSSEQELKDFIDKQGN